MKVLIVANDVGSKEMGMLFRPYYIAKGLREQGIKVQVVTSSYSHVRRLNPKIKSDLECHLVDGIPYHWIKSFRYHGNTLQRAFSMVWFSLKLWLYAGYFAKATRPDAVIASSPHPLVVWGAHRIAQKSGGKFFFEVRDIWPLTMHELSGMSESHPFYRLCQWAEDYAYANAEKVISLLPYAYEHMKTRGLPKEKFVFIPNGFDENDIKNKKPLFVEVEERIQQFKKHYPVTVGYAGAHGLANSLDALISAMEILGNDKQIGLILVGTGPEKAALINRVNQLGLKNVLFLDPVSKYQVLSVLDHFNIAYIGLKKTPLFRFGVSPNKLIDYMALSKPVLYAIDSERDPVQESGCGVKVSSDSPKELAEAILRMAKLSKEELESLGRKGHQWVRSNVAYDVLIQKMIKTLSPDGN